MKTAKHRVFQFLDSSILPDSKLIAITLEDSFFLGVLSSRAHVLWATAAGSHLGVGNDPTYVKSASFDAFPFPIASIEQQTLIRNLAEQLDGLRKRVLAEHEQLTLTGLYNVLAKLRSDAVLSAKEKSAHELGFVGVIKSLHDELDAAVLDAYGWNDLIGQPASDDVLLERLVALNAERTAEESTGTVRWLRPEFQNPGTTSPSTSSGKSAELGLETMPAPATADGKLPWPTDLPDQVAAITRTLAASNAPQSLDAITACFSGRGKWKARLPQILDTLVALGRARTTDTGWINHPF